MCYCEAHWQFGKLMWQFNDVAGVAMWQCGNATQGSDGQTTHKTVKMAVQCLLVVCNVVMQDAFASLSTHLETYLQQKFLSTQPAAQITL